MPITHEFAREALAPYVDGALPLAEAAAIRAHLADCSACADEVRGLEQLNRAMAFAPAPPVAFDAFWAGIEKALPGRRQARVRVVRRSLALAFALAALLVLTTAASAFASDRILPDSPLYSLKLAGENVRVTLTLDHHDRLQLEVQLAAERLREAKWMADERKNQLAVAALRRFQSLLVEATPALRHPAPAERQNTLDTIGTMRQDLTEVEQAATRTPDETDAQVEAIVQDSQASLAQDEQDSESSAGESPRPSNLPKPSDD